MSRTDGHRFHGFVQHRSIVAALSGPVIPPSSPAHRPGQYVAIDCEMVGVGFKGSESVLARVSIVNWHGYVLYDRFVRPMEKVTDYRTWVSGVRAVDLKDAPVFKTVQEEVSQLIKGRVLVGHAIQNDLKALLLSHPRPLIRDTATFQPLRDLAKTKHPGLKKLANLVLGIDIQKAGQEHSSVEDARTTMAVFRTQKEAWEKSLRRRGGEGGGAAATTSKSSSSSSDAAAAAKAWDEGNPADTVGAGQGTQPGVSKGIAKAGDQIERTAVKVVTGGGGGAAKGVSRQQQQQQQQRQQLGRPKSRKRAEAAAPGWWKEAS